MARVENPSLRLRGEARQALLRAGGRGFVRFLPEGDALLVSDAPRRCASGAESAELAEALARAGFTAALRDGLMLITPSDERLRALAAGGAPVREIDWNSPLHSAAALAGRWRREEAAALSADGRTMIVETLRLLWQPQERVLEGLGGLRARAAGMLRAGDRSGLREAGAVLDAWIQSVS